MPPNTAFCVDNVIFVVVSEMKEMPFVVSLSCSPYDYKMIDTSVFSSTIQCDNRKKSAYALL